MPRTGFMMIAAALLGSTAANAASALSLPHSLARVSAAEFAQRVTVEADPLMQTVALSTRKAGTPEGPSHAVLVSDAHARAVIDTRSDRPSFQVWHEFEYDGKLAEIAAVHYSVAGTTHKAKPIGLDQWLSNCGPDSGGCYGATRVGFELPSAHLHAIAASHAPLSREPWLIEFEDKAGKRLSIGFAPAELAGLSQAHERWRAAGK